MLATFVSIALTAILIENFVLIKFLGVCPFLGVSKKLPTAIGMGAAVTFVMTISSAATTAVQKHVLVPLELEYMQTIVFILIIASLVQVAEMFIHRAIPSLYSALGIYLPLIATNCAVLGVAILNVGSDYNVGTATFYGLMSGLGFMLAILLLAGVNDRLESSNIPKHFRGFPITLISAGLISMAFMAFSGLKI